MDIKIIKGDKFYVLSSKSPFDKNKLWITNQDEEGLGVSHSSLFDLLDKYFKEHF